MQGDSNTSNLICFLILVVCFVAKLGLSDAIDSCSPSAVSIEQSETGRKIKSKKEWMVVVNSKCLFDLFDVQITCPKNDSIVDIDTTLIYETQDGICVIPTLRGFDLGFDGTITFNYIGDRVDIKALNNGTSDPYDACPLSEVKIEQEKKDKEWIVAVYSNCLRDLGDVKISCPRNESIVDMDRNLIDRPDQNGVCVIPTLLGADMGAQGTITFTYVGDRVDIKPLSYGGY